MSTLLWFAKPFIGRVVSHDCVACFVLACLTVQFGCHREKAEGSADKSVVIQELPNADPSTVFRQMEQAYRDAGNYSDRGRVVLRYRERGEIRTDEAPLAVAVRLPSELRVEAYYSVVVSNGRQLLAKISDESSGDIDGQILIRDLNGNLTLEQVYHDVTLREAMTSGMGGQPLQLNLLYADDPLKSVFAEDAKLRMLEPEELEGHYCYRVVADGAEGEFVFWIDGTTFVLRRLDYPAAAMLPELAQSDLIQDLSLRVEFRDATFGPKFDEATFQLDIAADAKRVRTFVLPPHPLPTTLFGKSTADFTCYGLDGSKIGQKSLLGKTAVLVWFNNHPACRSTIEQLSEVYAARREDDTVVFFAVSTEPSRVSNSQLEATLASWNATVPVLRDLDAGGRDLLGVPWTPTMIVLDAEGIVQIFEVGANADLAQELPTILDRLRAGDDLANEIIADHFEQTETYGRTLAAAMAEAVAPTKDLTPASNSPAPEPTNAELNSQ
ncbi:MAG TPA: redoxin domain-containing protein [Pirellulaceae bacterium]|nr:redoxin domain-containing protein [Pirellulaceae bacterium]